MIRRINFHGGPGCGKSTLAPKVFAELKIRHYDVEQITEFVKTMAHEGRFPKSFDQVYIMGEQIHREDIALRHVNQIVTDCPIFLCAAYAEFYESKGRDHILGLAEEFEEEFPSLDFYIERTVPYVDKGRYQDFKEAEKFDDFLQDRLKWWGDFKTIRVDEFDEIMEQIENAIEVKDS